MKFEIFQRIGHDIANHFQLDNGYKKTVTEFEHLFAVTDAKSEYDDILQALNNLGATILQPLDARTPKIFIEHADPTEEFVRYPFTDQLTVLQQLLTHHKNNPHYNLTIDEYVNHIGPLIWLTFKTPNGLSITSISHYLREPNQIQALELTAVVNDRIAEVNFLIVPESDHLHADIHSYFDRLGYNEIQPDEDDIDFMIQSYADSGRTSKTEFIIFRDLGSISVPSIHSFIPRQFRLYGELDRQTITQPKKPRRKQ